jgi:hypothetical protein
MLYKDFLILCWLAAFALMLAAFALISAALFSLALYFVGRCLVNRSRARQISVSESSLDSEVAPN